jgi:hypothetical protein
MLYQLSYSRSMDAGELYRAGRPGRKASVTR